jgi:archaeal cell division control protein 6
MANLFDKNVEINLLKDERLLYPEYVPEQLPFRDQEIGEMVFALKPATLGKKPTALFLTGVPGTGKTVSSKYVLNELAEYSDRTKCLYINCFEFNSKHSILSKLTNFLGYAVPTRGLSTDEIFERFVAVLRSKESIPMVVFDEAEQLLKQDDTKDLLYDLSRMGERYKVFVGLIFISNDNMFLSVLDDRIRSSLQASTINFEKYTSLQLKEILKERASYAFYDNVLDDEVIPLCAAHASKEGDARVAIDILLKASRLAERKNSSKVLVSHVRAAFMQEKVVKQELSTNLSKQEQLILDYINGKEVIAGDIYLGLKDEFAERTLRKAISDLEGKNLIKTKKVKKGKGMSRIISKV